MAFNIWAGSRLVYDMKLTKKLRFWSSCFSPIALYDFTPKSYLDKPVIVSLTTVPSRVKYLKATILSILKQSVQPAYISLNLGKKPKKQDIPWSVPLWLQKLKSVKIFWQEEDYGPATKFIPTLLRHGNDDILIIIIDDDMIYPKNLIQNFIAADRQAKGEHVFCANGHLINANLDCNFPASRRIKSGQNRVAVIEGCGGYCLRPKHLALDSLVDFNNAPDKAWLIDDLWISGNLSKNKILKYQIASGKRKSLLQSMQPAIIGARAELSNKILNYFKNYWAEDELFK